ncbi:hypothetical protein [Streptomyces lydicus]|uniref:hypothetical protein n=1 Tax=Streptomyces lydicus TaxID=47763 RepID=UPI0037B41E96
MHPEEREGYIERLEAFVEQHRARLEELLRAYGPGSRPASHGRYTLVGQPETLVILERMETNPFGLRSEWQKELSSWTTSSSHAGRASASAGEQSSGQPKSSVSCAKSAGVGLGRGGGGAPSWRTASQRSISSSQPFSGGLGTPHSFEWPLLGRSSARPVGGAEGREPPQRR